LNPAVSRVCNPQNNRHEGRSNPLPGLADYKSAIQQSATLRYDSNAGPQIGFLSFLVETWSRYYGIGKRFWGELPGMESG
jgi:hypothetical protein